MTFHKVPEAAKQLRCSESWLYAQVAARAVPHTRIAGRVLFSDDDLARIAAAGRIEPARRSFARPA